MVERRIRGRWPRGHRCGDVGGGEIIVATIVAFQFIALQMIAVVMLSTSISNEIHHKTLGLLMTTPITSFQIICGKLLSTTVQLFLLLAISFPLLAILRVFGGVPWDYVISSFCITATSVLFAAALSLYFSIGSRYAYVVILRTVFVLGILYFFIPVLIVMIIVYIYYYTLQTLPPFSNPDIFERASIFNPFLTMSLNTSSVFIPANVLGAANWTLHCLVMLFLASLVIARSVKVVRRVALRQATGQLDYSRPMKNEKQERISAFSGGRHIANRWFSAKEQGHIKKDFSPIREVKGEALVWKEKAMPLVEGGKRKVIAAAAAAIIALFISYYSNLRGHTLEDSFSHIGYSLVFVMLGLITNIAFSATSITSEKESASWPILLATPLTDRQIIYGKGIGTLRRCAPFWFFLAGHVIMFTFLGYIHPVAVIHLAMIIIPVLVFLNGSGLYFGSRFRHTTTAVVMNFALVLILWFVLPLTYEYIAVLSGSHNPSGITISANPVVQTMVIMNTDSGVSTARGSVFLLVYEWPFKLCKTFFSTTALLSVFLLFHSGLGLFFAWRAKCNVRRNIF